MRVRNKNAGRGRRHEHKGDTASPSLVSLAILLVFCTTLFAISYVVKTYGVRRFLDFAIPLGTLGAAIAYRFTHHDTRPSSPFMERFKKGYARVTVMPSIPEGSSASEDEDEGVMSASAAKGNKVVVGGGASTPKGLAASSSPMFPTSSSSLSGSLYSHHHGLGTEVPLPDATSVAYLSSWVHTAYGGAGDNSDTRAAHDGDDDDAHGDNLAASFVLSNVSTSSSSFSSSTSSSTATTSPSPSSPSSHRGRSASDFLDLFNWEDDDDCCSVLTEASVAVGGGDESFAGSGSGSGSGNGAEDPPSDFSVHVLSGRAWTSNPFGTATASPSPSPSPSTHHQLSPSLSPFSPPRPASAPPTSLTLTPPAARSRASYPPRRARFGTSPLPVPAAKASRRHSFPSTAATAPVAGGPGGSCSDGVARHHHPATGMPPRHRHRAVTFA